MGFLKNVGQTLKKEVSFKNLVKVAGKASGFIPGFGSVIQGQIEATSAAVQAKKDARRAIVLGDTQNIPALVAASDLASANAAKFTGSISKSVSSSIVNATLQEAQKGISQSVINQGGSLGATIVNATLKQWFLKNWSWILVIGSATAIYYKYFCCGPKRYRKPTYRRF
jgi:hypothetical protein